MLVIAYVFPDGMIKLYREKNDDFVAKCKNDAELRTLLKTKNIIIERIIKLEGSLWTEEGK